MQIVLMDFSRHWGSTQRHLVAMALLLRAEKRFDTHICCPADSPLARKAKAQGLPLLALSPSYINCWWNPLHFVRLWLLTRRHRNCIFHTFSDAAARMALRLQQKRQPGRTVIIHNCHTVHSLATRNEQGAMPLWWQQLQNVLCADAIVRTELLNAGLDAAKVVRLPAGVDTSDLRPCINGYQSVPTGTGHKGPEKRCIILSMTSRADSACHSVLIKTMAALWQSESIPPWEVRIVGQCDNFAQLLAEANALGVQSRLALLQAQPLAEVLPLGHIMVSPGTSPHGSLPVLAAAWATGLPLVCPDLATNNEWVTANKNALLYKAEDPQDLAMCLKNLMTAPTLYRNLVDGGLHTLSLTTQDTALARTREMYTQCIRKHGWVLPPEHSATGADDAPQAEAAGNAPESATISASPESGPPEIPTGPSTTSVNAEAPSPSDPHSTTQAP